MCIYSGKNRPLITDILRGLQIWPFPKEGREDALQIGTEADQPDFSTPLSIVFYPISASLNS